MYTKIQIDRDIETETRKDNERYIQRYRYIEILKQRHEKIMTEYTKIQIDRDIESKRVTQIQRQRE